MHIAPLMVLMNSKSPEEFSAVGQMLLSTYLPSLSQAQARTLGALSAQQSVGTLEGKLDQCREQGREEGREQGREEGRQEFEDEVLSQLQAMLTIENWQVDDSSALGRIRGRLGAFLEANETTILETAVENMSEQHSVVAVLDSLKESHPALSRDLRRALLDLTTKIACLGREDSIPVIEELREESVQDQGDGEEVELMQEVSELIEIMRGKPKHQRLKPEELRGLPILEGKLEVHALDQDLFGKR